MSSIYSLFPTHFDGRLRYIKNRFARGISTSDKSRASVVLGKDRGQVLNVSLIVYILVGIYWGIDRVRWKRCRFLEGREKREK